MKKSYWIVLALLLIGCSSNLPVEVATSTAQVPDRTAILPTMTLTMVPTITPTSTKPLSSPIPTAIAKEDTGITLELLQTNNHCELPCWWGIVPNQTNWADANRFLKSFSEIYERPPSTEWLVYEVYSPLRKEFSETQRVRAVYATQQGIVKEIDISGFNEKTYNLSAILMKYGAPTEIILSAYSSDLGSPEKQVPLSIDLHYPEKGINVLYGSDAFMNGEVISGCFRDPHLFLWSPQEHARSIEYILGWKKIKLPYLSLEEATDMDIQAFYEKYSNPANQPCLGTPAKLWPIQ